MRQHHRCCRNLLGEGGAALAPPTKVHTDSGRRRGRFWVHSDGEFGNGSSGSSAQERGEAEQATHSSAPQSWRVVVIGAGPAGSTAALALAKRGFNVDVYEKRPEPKHDQVGARRSHLIVLTERGISALEELGISLQQEAGAACPGTVTQHFGSRRRRTPAKPGSLFCFDRADLAQLLIDRVQKLGGGSVRFRFQWACEHLDLTTRMATFGDPQGDSVEVPFDLVVGADGVNSILREALLKTVPSFQVSLEDGGREYKAFGGLRAVLEPRRSSTSSGAALYRFVSADGWTCLTCRRDAGGTYRGTLALRRTGFEALESRQDYEQLIRTVLRGVPRHWPPLIAQQCLYGPTASQGKRVRCSTLHGPAAVLVGDAAHSVTAAVGHGCDAAVEDGAILGRIAASAGDDLSSLPGEWTARRHRDAQALLNLEAMLSRQGVHRLWFLEPACVKMLPHLAVGFLLHKLMPWWFGPPALTRMGSTMPYSEIERRVNRDAAAALVALLGAVAAIALRLLRVC